MSFDGDKLVSQKLSGQTGRIDPFSRNTVFCADAAVF